MEIRFLNFIRGYIRIRIMGNSYERFLNLCAYHGICLRDLQPAGEGYEAFILAGDFKKLKSIVKKSHTSVVITGRWGLPFFIHRYRKRKYFLMAVLAAGCFMFWLSAHIWNITIEGNVSQTDDVIFEYLDGEGIRHGMVRSGLDCKALAAGIRNYFPRFSWVAAELKGTRLVIHVKEGIIPETGSEDTEVPSSLAASRSGTVLSIVTRSGRPLVKVGDTVEKDEILVSGILPIYNDSGEISIRQYAAADADIIIQYTLSYRDRIAAENQGKRYTGREKTSYLYRMGDLSFALPDQFDSFGQYDLTMEMNQLRLGENFYLPVFLKKFTAMEYENVEIIYTKEQMKQILQGNFQDFVKNLEEKGVQIFENDVKIEWTEKYAVASGTLIIGESAVRRVASSDTEEELLKNEYG